MTISLLPRKILRRKKKKIKEGDTSQEFEYQLRKNNTRILCFFIFFILKKVRIFPVPLVFHIIIK